MMKNNEELIKLLQTETTHIVKTNEQSLKQAKKNDFENLLTQR